MFEKILYPTDFSEYAQKMIECTGELKYLGVGEIVLLHVIDPKEIMHPYREETFVKKAEEKVNKMKKELEKMGFRVKTRVSVEVPSWGIIKVADEENVSLIMIGARGKGLLREAFIGSVSGEVLRHGRPPVLIIKSRVIDRYGEKVIEACRIMFRKVMYPTDFSDCSGIPLELIKRLKIGISEVVLIHVVEKGETLEEIENFRREAKEKLEKIREELEKEGIKSYIHVHTGIASKEILKIAEDEEISIIVIGALGKSLVKEILVGSTTSKVVRESRVPVLVTKCKEVQGVCVPTWEIS